MIKRKFNLFLLVTLLLTFYNCTIPTDFYIQNSTKTTQKIEITHSLKSSLKLKNAILKSFSLKAVTGIHNPKKFQQNKTDVKLLFTETSDSTFVFYAKPNTTIQIAKSSNYRWANYLIKNITINNESLSISQLKSKSERMKHDYIYKID
mgnify:CR=1 FL=1